MRSALRGYLACTRAGATAATGVLVTIGAFLGVGLAGDYLVLLGQRDMLKVAANAATIATSKYFAGMELGSVEDDELGAKLGSIARRYLLANIPRNKRQDVSDTLQLTITPNQASRTVAITAQADLGGILFLDNISMINVADIRVTVSSGAIGDISSSEVVLAIDVTSSMFYTIAGEYPPNLPDYKDYPEGYPFTKMNVVKEAAVELVDILNPDGNGAAIGLVPWHYRVRLGADQRDRWIRENWARYAEQRTYPRPYRGAPASGEVATMPPKVDRAPWNGCFDQRSLTGSPPPALASVLPWNYPFTMSYYTHEIRNSRVGFACVPQPDQDYCYDPNADPIDISDRLDPQANCEMEGWGHNGSPAFIVPLTTDSRYLRGVIDRVSEGGSSTYSAVGVIWALRLLDPGWRPVWGDPVFPRASTPDDGTVTKVIVLLTDGEDNHTSLADEHLAYACKAAKDAGVRIFVVTAMALSRTSDRAFIRRLRDCSSQADFPDVQHVFVNNATPKALRAAFGTIAHQLQRIRRTH